MLYSIYKCLITPIRECIQDYILTYLTCVRNARPSAAARRPSLQLDRHIIADILIHWLTIQYKIKHDTHDLIA